MHEFIVWVHGQAAQLHIWSRELIRWYLDSLSSGGYPVVVLLMAIESSVFPLPSELVIPPAVFVAKSQGIMTVPGIVLAGALGSWLGASLMYWIARIAGRPFVIRFGRYFLMPREKIELVERWAARYGEFGVFAARFILVVRHLIGIPAGIVRLNYVKFSFYTFLGSLIWCSALGWVAVQAGKNQALMRGELKSVTEWIIGALMVFGAIYYFFVHKFARRAA
jgi:membrane protein DedA with SNARE-associated domain